MENRHYRNGWNRWMRFEAWTYFLGSFWSVNSFVYSGGRYSLVEFLRMVVSTSGLDGLFSLGFNYAFVPFYVGNYDPVCLFPL